MITMEKKHELDLRNTARACRAEGRAEGEDRFAKLADTLLDTSRIGDLKKSATDLEYRERLYEELGL